VRRTKRRKTQNEIRRTHSNTPPQIDQQKRTYDKERERERERGAKEPESGGKKGRDEVR